MQVVEFVAQCEFGRGDYGETVVSVGLTDEEAARLRRMADEHVKEAVEEGDKVDSVYGITIDWPEEYKPEEDE